MNEIAEKLIEAKEKSEIVNKQDLISDVHQCINFFITAFEEVVVDVYSQNEQLKKKMANLVAIIKDQTHKISSYKEREDKLK